MGVSMPNFVETQRASESVENRDVASMKAAIALTGHVIYGVTALAIGVTAATVSVIASIVLGTGAFIIGMGTLAFMGTGAIVIGVAAAPLVIGSVVVFSVGTMVLSMPIALKAVAIASLVLILI